MVHAVRSAGRPGGPVSCVGLALLLLLLNAAVATAQEAGPEPAHAPQGHHTEHHANHLAAFLGASTLTGELPEGSSGTAFTLGLDYERRLSRWFGLGVLAEFVIGGLGRASLLGVPLFVHPVGDLALVFAPGVEFESEDAADPEVVVSFSDDEGAHSNTHFAFRVGATYALRPAPRFSLVPQFNADFIAGEGPTLVYGLAFGFGF